MTYPLIPASREVWNRILQLVREIAVFATLSAERYVTALNSGKRFEEFPAHLLVQLRILLEENWTAVQPLIPEIASIGLNLRRREWFSEAFEPSGNAALQSKLRWVVLDGIAKAAQYVLNRDKEAQLEPSERTKRRERPQQALKEYLHFIVSRKQGMEDLTRLSAPDSRVRYLFYEDLFPNVEDVTQTRLNRAISEARRTGEQTLLGPRLEAIQSAFCRYAERFLEYPQGDPEYAAELHEAIKSVLAYLEKVTDQPAEAQRAFTAEQVQPAENPPSPPPVEPQPDIPRRAQIAGEQYRQATEAFGSELLDRDAYDNLVAALMQSGELEDLPTFDTWGRNLREFRRLTGQQKYQPRAGRAPGTSIVIPEQLDPSQLPTRIRPPNSDN